MVPEAFVVVPEMSVQDEGTRSVLSGPCALYLTGVIDV